MGARLGSTMLPCQFEKVRFVSETPLPEAGVSSSQAPFMSSAYAFECPMKFVNSELRT